MNAPKLTKQRGAELRALAAKFTPEQLGLMVEIVSDARSTGGCRQGNDIERAMLATAFKKLSERIGEAFPVMREWYCGRTYGPGEPQDVADKAETAKLLAEVGSES